MKMNFEMAKVFKIRILPMSVSRLALHVLKSRSMASMAFLTLAFCCYVFLQLGNEQSC